MDFTTNMALQCRAFSRVLKIESYEPDSPVPRGQGIQIACALSVVVSVKSNV